MIGMQPLAAPGCAACQEPGFRGLCIDCGAEVQDPLGPGRSLPSPQGAVAGRFDPDLVGRAPCWAVGCRRQYGHAGAHDRPQDPEHPAVLAERERCARILDQLAEGWIRPDAPPGVSLPERVLALRIAAKLVRSRGRP